MTDSSTLSSGRVAREHPAYATVWRGRRPRPRTAETVLMATAISTSAREYQTVVGAPLVPVVSAISAGAETADTKAAGSARRAAFGVTGTWSQVSGVRVPGSSARLSNVRR